MSGPQRAPTSRFHQALAYASMLHQDQTRKKTQVPYVSHLLSACAIALSNGADETEAIAALLHDAIEDQGGEAQRARIASLFGAEVARIVVACSDSIVDTAAGAAKRPWHVRKLEHLAHLAAQTDGSVLLVTAADALDNLRSIVRDHRESGDALWARFNGRKEGTLWYHASIARIIAAKTSIDERLRPIAAELQELLGRLPARDEGYEPAESSTRPP